MWVRRLTLDNHTRKAALKILDPRTPVEDEALLTSEWMFAVRLEKELGRPMERIGSREYTRHRAAAIVEYAQAKIIEARAQLAQARAARKGRR